jgi:uncharacterized protein with GYD domain
MPRYAWLGGLTPETWARFIQNPEDRRPPLQKAVEAVGGKLIDFYYSFGEDDFLLIAEFPDDNAAAAFAIGRASVTLPRSQRTVKLISSDDMSQILQKAKIAAGAAAPPGGARG